MEVNVKGLSHEGDVVSFLLLLLSLTIFFTSEKL